MSEGGTYGGTSTPSTAASPDQVGGEPTTPGVTRTWVPLHAEPTGLAGRRCRMDDRENLDTLSTGWPAEPIWRTGTIVEAGVSPSGRSIGWTVVVLTDDDPTHPRAWYLSDVELIEDEA